MILYLAHRDKLLDKKMNQNIVYTHQLPFKIRRDICNLLDADFSWRMLGGQEMRLNNTELELVGHAIFRNGSPTEELLKQLDRANCRISEFCYYLRRINHDRAVGMLTSSITGHGSDSAMTMNNNVSGTLHTPTPSFAECPQIPALMAGADAFSSTNNPQANVILQTDSTHFSRQYSNNLAEQSLPGRCHKVGATSNLHHQTQQPNGQQHQQQINETKEDPGEEMVRLACANNRKRTSISDQEVVNQLRLIMQIAYKELKKASDDFTDLNILGNGGFASVYRGHWKGNDVAIKRLRCNLVDQALNELTILNSYRIDNILPIYGISIDGPEACLVYQFMANGSLEDRLACKGGTLPLSWSQRALIGEGVAKGLYYLHSLRSKPMVHGDVKSANVLLDAQFIAKLGDFGLARQVFNWQQTSPSTHCIVSSIHGTSVYLPSEYLREKILSTAVDVYSYGIVLLEMATGRRAYDGKRLLIDFVRDVAPTKPMEELPQSLRDPRLTDDSQMSFKIWYELLVTLGLNCAHQRKTGRPNMGQVLKRFASFPELSEDRTRSTATTTPEPVSHPIPVAINSALMSIDEEIDAGARKTAAAAEEEPPVEAAIPLLTELGIVE